MARSDTLTVRHRWQSRNGRAKSTSAEALPGRMCLSALWRSRSSSALSSRAVGYNPGEGVTWSLCNPYLRSESVQWKDRLLDGRNLPARVLRCPSLRVLGQLQDRIPERHRLQAEMTHLCVALGR